MSRVIIAALISAFVFAGSVSAQPTTLKADLLACKSIDKKKKRLACLDSILFRLEPSSPVAVNGDLDSSTKVADSEIVYGESKPPSEDEFGKEDLLRKTRAKDNSPKTLTANLVEIAQTKQGKYIIILDNGQVWRQLKADTDNCLLYTSPSPRDS